MQTEKFDLWCLVELFGHTKIAGRCTEQNIAGTNMLRVDVPETTKQPAFTRFFGASAIYAINPIDEETAKFYAEKLEIAPIQSYNLGELIKKHNELLLASSTPPAAQSREEVYKQVTETKSEDDTDKIAPDDEDIDDFLEVFPDSKDEDLPW
jgi:ribosomal protein L12E/L44/L45/RPP1/RPP2